MRRMVLLFCALAVVGALFIHCQPAEEANQFPADGRVKIVRDAYGVPHIYANDDYDMMYGFGYAVAADRARQIFTTVLTTRGRLAELAGEGALENDKLMRMFRLHPLAAEKLDQLPSGNLRLIEAYCAGVNASVELRSQELPEWVGRLEPVDVLAAMMMINLDFALMSRDSPAADLRRSDVGSNQFAVAPERAAGGHALLSLDPHLPFYGTYRWTEAQLSTPQHSVVGAVIPAVPIVALGHNGRVAWSLTVNFPDLADIYAEEINPDNPSRYLTPDGWRDFSEWSETFRIRTDDGYREETFTFRATRHGPVIANEQGVAYAACIAGLGETGLLQIFLDMMRAQTVEEFFDAFRTPGLNMQNVVAADTTGTIGYFYNALIPRRDPELDWSRAVPGADPRAEWGDYVPFDELPQIINPSSGWLQNCNNSPWYVTRDSGIVAEALANRLCTVDYLGFREQRMTELLEADGSVTFDEAIAYATDTEVLRARLWVPQLIAAFEAYRDRMSLAGTPTEEAIELLRSWDLRCDADSPAMALFFSWYTRGALGSIREASQISEDIKQKQMIELGMAAAELEDAFGRIDVPWGEMLRLSHGRQSYPISGGGAFDVLRSALGRRNGPGLTATAGSSYQMVVELSPTPVARSCFPFGISEDPDSPHFADVTKLYARKEYKPVWFTPDEVEAHAESTIELEVPRR